MARSSSRSNAIARWTRRAAALALAAGAAMAYLAVDEAASPATRATPAATPPAAAAVAVGAGVLLLIAAVASTATWAARQRTRARIGRLWRHEFWPWYIYYAPLVVWLAWLGLRYRGIMTFTCVNPALGPGGGVIGESKARILDAMGADAALLAHELLPAGPDPDCRVRRLEAALDRRPELGGWPVILKPDRGERGYAVRLCRGPGEARAYLQQMPHDVIAQRYHPGPHECAVFWVRDERAPAGGVIFSATRKEFQTLTGDGQRTLEALVLGHPRLRMQADVFLRRFAGERRRVLGAGETLRMSESGNHCQGTLFRDGADLVTEALAARIGGVVGRIAGPDGGPGFDFGRMDIRYRSEEGLQRGEGLGIVELNGATSESTNMYDPDRSVWWAWGVLLRQWEAAYRLGAQRRAAGARPLGVVEVVRLVVRERMGRNGQVWSS